MKNTHNSILKIDTKTFNQEQLNALHEYLEKETIKGFISFKGDTFERTRLNTNLYINTKLKYYLYSTDGYVLNWICLNPESIHEVEPIFNITVDIFRDVDKNSKTNDKEKHCVLYIDLTESTEEDHCAFAELLAEEQYVVKFSDHLTWATSRFVRINTENKTFLFTKGIIGTHLPSIDVLKRKNMKTGEEIKFKDASDILTKLWILCWGKETIDRKLKEEIQTVN